MGVPKRESTGFGIARTGQNGHRIEAFFEKPADPPLRPGRPDEVFASMGNYIFETGVLVKALTKDAGEQGSRHGVGGDIIPMLVREGVAHAYDFAQNEVPGVGPRDLGYWRELGTLDAYFEAHMDLCGVRPAFSFYNRRWPILTLVPPEPPAKLIDDESGHLVQVIDSVVSNGVIVRGGSVRNSVLSPGVWVDSRSRVDRAVILHGSRVGSGAIVQNAILDKNVVIAEGAAVGVDHEHDKARGFTVSAGGITVVGKGKLVTP
jgi:glucose-1-phosphate adenylyltransferase